MIHMIHKHVLFKQVNTAAITERGYATSTASLHSFYTKHITVNMVRQHAGYITERTILNPIKSPS